MVVELTSSNFDEIVGKEKYVVVKFYTRWCGYCRLMAPEYDKLFNLYKDKREDVVIARLEGSLNEEISYRYRIFSFPMVVLFHPHEIKIKSLFQSQRLASVMSEWIDKNAPTVKSETEKPHNQTATDSSQEKTKSLNDKNLDENLVIVKVNKTETTDELEYVKREISALKQKINSLELEINSFKNNTNLNGALANNNSNINFKMPSTFSVVVFVAFLFILIAAILTVKRVFFKKRIAKDDPALHAKV